MAAEKKIRMEPGWYRKVGSEYEYLEVFEDGKDYYDFEVDIERQDWDGSGNWQLADKSPKITEGVVVWDVIHKYHPEPFLPGLRDTRWSHVTLIALDKSVVIYADDKTYAGGGWLEYTALKLYFDLDEFDDDYQLLPVQALGKLKETHRIEGTHVKVKIPADKAFMLVYEAAESGDFLFGTNDPNFVLLMTSFVLQKEDSQPN